MHIVLVDNGRSERLGLEEFWTSLKCIRCGACMNTCPVYRRSGGLSYGATYSGPIGLIIDPTFNARKYSNLPFASTLNGSCTNVCPVKINIHEQIYAWRRELVKQHEVPLRQEGRDESGRRAAVAARPPIAPPSPQPMSRSPICRGSSSTTASTPGARTARNRIRPSRRFTAGISANRGEQRMSSRDEILASIRANRPELERPLPAVPLFDDRPPASLLAAFKENLERMGGVFLDPPADRRRPRRPFARRSRPRRSSARPFRRSRAIATLRRSARRRIWPMSISRWSARLSPSPRRAPSC